MSNIRLSTRYAKSLINLAAERGETDVLLKDMLFISSSIRSSKDLQIMLASPVISGDKKRKVLFSVFTELNKTTHVFIDLIVSKGRESDLGEIAQSFVQQVKAGRNIFDVELISAVLPMMLFVPRFLKLRKRFVVAMLRLQKKLIQI